MVFEPAIECAEPRTRAALRLVLLTLHRIGGVVANEGGRATQNLLKMAEVTEGQINYTSILKRMRLLQDDGLITLNKRESKNRTYEISLNRALTTEEIEFLEGEEAEFRRVLGLTDRASEAEVIIPISELNDLKAQVATLVTRVAALEAKVGIKEAKQQ